MVVITDPHIKQDESFHVMKNGMSLEGKDIADTHVSIFVKNSKSDLFFGHCWPGSSAWVDFFNKGA